MQKIVVHAAGGYEALRLETHPSPPCGPGRVRVAVEAAGVNYADCVVRMGLYESAKKYVGWPITPGFDVAGAVAEVGEGVEGLAEGDPVIGVTRFGGYATEVVVPAEQVMARPAGWSAVRAAAFPTVHLTAWYGLVELCRPRPGGRVLVHSAAGGVGGALLSITAILEGTAVGVVGASHKIEAARTLGAAHVLDKSRVDWAREARSLSPEGYDVVLDANGAATLRDSYDLLGSGGRLVVYGFHTMLPRGRGRPSWPKLAVDWLRTPRFDPLALTGDNKAVMGFNLSYLFERTALFREAMDDLLGWAAAGRLPEPETRTFPLARAADAHRALESAQTVGKLVLTCP